MGGSDARPSFFAHLPHLGPSGGDFKASRRNCRLFSSFSKVSVDKVDIWSSFSVFEIFIGCSQQMNLFNELQVENFRIFSTKVVAQFILLLVSHKLMKLFLENFLC